MRDFRRRIGRLESQAGDGNEPPPYGLASLLAWGTPAPWADERGLPDAPGVTGLLARAMLEGDDGEL